MTSRLVARTLRHDPHAVAFLDRHAALGVHAHDRRPARRRPRRPIVARRRHRELSTAKLTGARVALLLPALVANVRDRCVEHLRPFRRIPAALRQWSPVAWIVGTGTLGARRKIGPQPWSRPRVPRRVRAAAHVRGPIPASAVATWRDGDIGHVDPELVEQPAEAPVQREVARDIGRIARVERLRERVDALRREAERLGHLAHGRACPVGDDRADHRRVIGAVAFVEVLDHLLAAVDVEVDVDVGQRPRLVDEALEEELVRDRVDLGDAEAVGHDRVAGAPPPLADDPAFAGELHQVPDDEEELGEVRALDDIELVGQLLQRLPGNRLVTEQ